jgi:hypothetical protein
MRRNDVPDPLGATKNTSTSAGGIMPVCSLKVMPVTCEEVGLLFIVC